MNGGVFRKLWTPPKEGTYIITAVFAGTKSYWDSYASTAVGVTTAPPEPPTPATAEQVSAAVEALQPWNMALTVLVVIAIVIGIYSIYDHRKLRK